MPIRDLNRCAGCRRWDTTPWMHVGCLPRVLAPSTSYTPAYKVQRFPLIKIARVDKQPGNSMIVLHLVCGHRQTRQRAQLRHLPTSVRCAECALAKTSSDMNDSHGTTPTGETCDEHENEDLHLP